MTSPSSAGSGTASSGFEIRVGGGTSIMPLVAPTLTNSCRSMKSLKLSRQSSGSSKGLRPPRPGCVRKKARARSRSTRVGIDEVQPDGR